MEEAGQMPSIPTTCTKPQHTTSSWAVSLMMRTVTSSSDHNQPVSMSSPAEKLVMTTDTLLCKEMATAHVTTLMDLLLTSTVK